MKPMRSAGVIGEGGGPVPEGRGGGIGRRRLNTRPLPAKFAPTVDISSLNF